MYKLYTQKRLKLYILQMQKKIFKKKRGSPKLHIYYIAVHVHT